MKRNNLLVIVAVMLLLGLGCFVVFQFWVDGGKDAEKILLTTNDAMGDFSIYDENGKEIVIRDIPGETLVILYVRSTCPDCTTQYNEYASLFKAYDKEDTNVIFLWEGSIPEDTREIFDIEEGNNYTTKNLIYFNNWVPTYFVLNSSKTIVYKGIEIEELWEYLNTEERN